MKGGVDLQSSAYALRGAKEMSLEINIGGRWMTGYEAGQALLAAEARVEALEMALGCLRTDFRLCYPILEGREGYCPFEGRDSVRRVAELVPEEGVMPMPDMTPKRLAQIRGWLEAATAGYGLSAVAANEALLDLLQEGVPELLAHIEVLEAELGVFGQMATLVGAEYGDDEWVVWIRGKNGAGQMHECGLQWSDLRRAAEFCRRSH